ncbi:MAG TPA: ATP-binding protein, partial [Thermodesulfobacteriota bacterium]|nr:ATP-binding protein [Thermodesulfobacteriota bacterium]
DQSQVAEVSSDLRRGSNPRRFSANRNYRKDGSVAYCEWYNSSLADESGNLRSILSLVLDVTERKKLEEELRRSRDELETRVEARTVELARANRELVEEMGKREKAEQQLRQAQKMEAIGTLTGGIAHDLNNILAPIVINAELALLTADGNARIRNNLDLILKSGIRGKELVKQLLLFSRKSERKQDTVSLTPLVKETFGLLRASIPATIQMKLHLETDTDSVVADPSQIQQVIMNLCTNAAYAMREKTGSIDISLRDAAFGPVDALEPDMEPGDYMVLSVKDTGCGMGDEVKKRIFEPFFTTKPAGEGTGLGLAVVYGIVKNHKGNITAYSEPGKGSVFNVYLPKVNTREAKPGEVMRPIPRGSERILVVDDEEFIVNSASDMLQHLGYRVAAFMDSRDALKAFSADPSQFDLVMTDKTMPHLTGEDLGNELMRIRPDIPVILFTGYADLITSERAEEMGFRGLIMKPFSLREGAELIRRVLDQREAGKKAPFIRRE